jgi:hypothetical protein
MKRYSIRLGSRALGVTVVCLSVGSLSVRLDAAPSSLVVQEAATSLVLRVQDTTAKKTTKTRPPSAAADKPKVKRCCFQRPDGTTICPMVPVESCP